MEIKLTRGMVAIIDDTDAELVVGSKWQSNRSGKNGWYAQRGVYYDGQTHIERMHNVIMGPTPEGMVVDHINGNGLDNRRSNLRFVTQTLNARNRTKNKSGYKGVHIVPDSGVFKSQITHNGKYVHISNFRDAKEAALVHDILALLCQQKESCLNFSLAEVQPLAEGLRRIIAEVDSTASRLGLSRKIVGDLLRAKSLADSE